MRQFAKTFEVCCLTNFGTAEHIPEFSDKPPRGSHLDEPVLEGAAQVLDDVPKCSNASTVQGSNCWGSCFRSCRSGCSQSFASFAADRWRNCRRDSADIQTIG